MCPGNEQPDSKKNELILGNNTVEGTIPSQGEINQLSFEEAERIIDDFLSKMLGSDTLEQFKSTQEKIESMSLEEAERIIDDFLVKNEPQN